MAGYSPQTAQCWLKFYNSRMIGYSEVILGPLSPVLVSRITGDVVLGQFYFSGNCVRTKPLARRTLRVLCSSRHAAR